MARHLLTDTHVRNAKPGDKAYRLRDGGRALLAVPLPARWEGQVATLGKLADVSLAQAREKADAARKRAQAGEHVATAKRVARATKATGTASTFDAIVSHNGLCTSMRFSLSCWQTAQQSNTNTF